MDGHTRRVDEVDETEMGAEAEADVEANEGGRLRFIPARTECAAKAGERGGDAERDEVLDVADDDESGEAATEATRDTDEESDCCSVRRRAAVDERDEAEEDEADEDEEDAQRDGADKTGCGCGGIRNGEVVMTVTACGLSSSISDVSSASDDSVEKPNK